jgi:hypothetical protein
MAQVMSLQTANLPTEAAGAALVAQLQSFPQLLQMPPFDQLLQAMAQRTTGDADPATDA